MSNEDLYNNKIIETNAFLSKIYYTTQLSCHKTVLLNKQNQNELRDEILSYYLKTVISLHSI